MGKVSWFQQQKHKKAYFPRWAVSSTDSNERMFACKSLGVSVIIHWSFTGERWCLKLFLSWKCPRYDFTVNIDLCMLMKKTFCLTMQWPRRRKRQRPHLPPGGQCAVRPLPVFCRRHERTGWTAAWAGQPGLLLFAFHGFGMLCSFSVKNGLKISMWFWLLSRMCEKYVNRRKMSCLLPGDCKLA